MDYLIGVNESSIGKLAMVFSVSTITIRRDIEEFRANPLFVSDLKALGVEVLLG